MAVEAPVTLNPGTGGDQVRAENTTYGKQQVISLADPDGTLVLASTLPDVTDRAARALGHVALDAGTNIIGNVGSALASYSGLGQIFVAGGMVALSATSPQGSLWISNPATSGKTLMVVQWSVYCQTSDAKVEYFADATSAGTVVTPFQTSDGGGVSAAQVKVGVGALSGGTAIPAGHISSANAPLEKAVPIFLPAGKSFAIRVAGYALSATAVDFGINVAYREF